MRNKFWILGKKNKNQIYQNKIIKKDNCQKTNE